MIEFFAAHPTLLRGRGKIHFVPAIFTTAQIYTSDVDLASANIETGDLNDGLTSLAEHPWIWL